MRNYYTLKCPEDEEYLVYCANHGNLIFWCVDHWHPSHKEINAFFELRGEPDHELRRVRGDMEEAFLRSHNIPSGPNEVNTRSTVYESRSLGGS